MKLTGSLYKNNKIIKIHTVVIEDSESSIRDKLEEMLIMLCKELDIQVPIWLDRNTREFGAFKKTSFTEDQFIEKLNFSKFEIMFTY